MTDIESCKEYAIHKFTKYERATNDLPSQTRH